MNRCFDLTELYMLLYVRLTPSYSDRHPAPVFTMHGVEFTSNKIIRNTSIYEVYELASRDDPRNF
jgi:hypothetical protein